MDLAALREQCLQLERRIKGEEDWNRLRRVYLDLAPLMGQLHGAVAEAVRLHGDCVELDAARQSLEQVRARARKVGLDIRLSSPAALSMGLEAALEGAREALDHLEASGSSGSRGS
jgi:hypothetical protein